MTNISTSYGGTAGPQVTLTYDDGGRLTNLSRTIGGTGTEVNTDRKRDRKRTGNGDAASFGPETTGNGDAASFGQPETGTGPETGTQLVL